MSPHVSREQLTFSFEEPAPPQAPPYTLVCDDVLRWAKETPPMGAHGLITDPPYSLGDGTKGFMNASWDTNIAFRPETWKALAQHLLPGAFILAFASSRGWHRLACAMEDAGLRIMPSIFGWATGCLSEDTEIFTNDGWKSYHNLLPGCMVMCYNMLDNSLAYMPVQEVYVYDYDETAYHLKSPATDQIVSRNHRCLVERDGRLVFQYAEALQSKENVPILESLSNLQHHLCDSRFDAMDEGQGILLEALRKGHACQSTTYEEPTAQAQGSCDCVCCLWERTIQACRMASQDRNSDMLTSVQWSASRSSVGETWLQRPSWLDERGPRSCNPLDDRSEKSCVEGWRDLLPQAWELQADQVCSMPHSLSRDGSQGWLCDGAPLDGRTGDWQGPFTRRGRPSYRSQSAEQCLNQLSALCEQPRPQAVRGSRLPSTTLATVTPIHYRGKVWCVQVPTGAFLARRNGQSFLTGNSSFPKATRIDAVLEKQRHDYPAIKQLVLWLREAAARSGYNAERINQHLGWGAAVANHFLKPSESNAGVPTWEQWLQLKALLQFSDEMDAEVWRLNGRKGQPSETWAQREVIGETRAGISSRSRMGDMVGGTAIESAKHIDVTAPATPLAQIWAGHRYGGQVMKDSLTPIIVAQVPYDQKPVQSIVKHGSGALWIDGVRLTSPVLESERRTSPTGDSRHVTLFGLGSCEGERHHPSGRWPPNFVLQHVSLPVLRLKGHLPPDTQDAITRYYAGYTAVTALRAGRNGAVHDGLEVLAGDIPEGWLDYFELTGEDLGCVAQGARQVRGAHSQGKNPSRMHPEPQGFVYGAWPHRSIIDHTDANGMEEVAAYQCHESCVVRKLDAQAGVRKSGGHIISGEHSDTGYHGHMTHREGFNGYQDIGGPSRFFQVSDWSLDVAERLAQADPAFYCAKASRSERQKGLNGHQNQHPTVKPLSLLIWLCRLLAPPAAYAPRRLLIPFAGVMSEACAAVISQQWESITAIEQDASYVEIGQQRLAYWSQQKETKP